MLPLDLHVLSLWLAFILSQDQTLRCNLYLYLFLAELTSYLSQVVSFKTSCSFAPQARRPRDASLASCHCTLFLLLLTTSFRWESGCKDMVLLPYRPNISGNIFWTFFFIFRQNVVPQAFGREKNFFSSRGGISRRGGGNGKGRPPPPVTASPLRMTCAVVRRAGAPRRVCTGMSWPCP